MIPRVNEQMQAPASVDMANMELAIPFSSGGTSMTTIACIVGEISPFPNPRRSPRQMIGARDVQNLIPNMQISTHKIPIIRVHLEPIPFVILPTVRRLIASVARMLIDAKYVRNNFDILVVCGIGGSYLGARAALEALNGLKSDDKMEIIFMGQTFSPNYVAQVMKYLKGKKFAINVISKTVRVDNPDDTKVLSLEEFKKQTGWRKKPHHEEN